MEKKTAGLIGAIASLATIGAAQAASRPAPTPAEVMHVTSYADLLTPIPNAAALLEASNAAPMQPKAPAVEDVQYYNGPPPHHHHHHHHHVYHRPPPRRVYHHHHHHHHGVTVVVPGVGAVHSD